MKHSKKRYECDLHFVAQAIKTISTLKGENDRISRSAVAFFGGIGVWIWPDLPKSRGRELP